MFRELPTFITSNAHKIEKFRNYCPLAILHRDIDLQEIQSLNTEEIVLHKVKEAYAKLQCAVLVEDVSLSIEGMNGLPGPFIKYFLQQLGTEAICKTVDALSDSTRKAVVEVMYGYYDGKEVEYFRNSVEGTISETPRGEGHGFNPIFIPDGQTMTWAEMSEQEKRRTSLRRPALERLTAYFSTS